jgi:hypothetical protein
MVKAICVVNGESVKGTIVFTQEEGKPLLVFIFFHSHVFEKSTEEFHWMGEFIHEIFLNILRHT